MNNNTIVSIPFHGTKMLAIEGDGTQWVSLRHVCDSMGIDSKSQRRKLRDRAWAREVIMTSQDASGREQDMFMIDRRTFTMWLATIDTNRVKDLEARRMIEAFQLEAADVLDSYFADGGAINPRATPDQLEGLGEKAARLAQQRLNLLHTAQGITHLDPTFMQTMAQMVVSKGLGVIPEIADEDQPIYLEDFLKERGHKGEELKKLRSTFGKKVAAAYLDAHGFKPAKAPADVGGRPRSVNYYTERDRSLIEATYAVNVPAKLEVLA